MTITNHSGQPATLRPGDALVPGDEVEFWSGDQGGCWKPGTVVPLKRVFEHVPEGENTRRGHSKSLRIQVGEGVWVVRPASKCRRRST